MKIYYDQAYDATMAHEGAGQRSNDRMDPGGETFAGISRVYWPEWAGWKMIDKWLREGEPFKPEEVALLEPMVRQFYRVNFWHRVQGDKLAEMSPKLSAEVFDSAVNMGVTNAVRFLQAGYNVGNGMGDDLLVDGLLGPKTLAAIKRYLATQPGTPALNEEILLNCMNGEQYIFYKNNPKHKYFRGWFRRV